MQDDVVMGTLTVKENLMFSANLRLPQTMDSEEKIDRVDEAIDDLGLDKCADTKVGMKYCDIVCVTTFSAHSLFVNIFTPHAHS